MKLKTVFLLSAALLIATSMSWAQYVKQAPDPADVSVGYCDPVLSNWGLDQVVWTTEPTATPFSRAASGIIGHYVYHFGSEGSNLAQAYDLNTDTWVASTPCLAGYDNWDAAVVNNADMYVVGRYDGAYHNDFYKFTPTAGGPAGVWTTLASYTQTLTGICLVWDGGDYLYAAGGDASTGYANRYDIAANTWSALPNMPGPMRYAGGSFCDGKFHIIGGVVGTGNGHYAFDPATNTWSTLAAVPVTVYFSLFSTTGNDQYVISIGGGGGYGSWPAVSAVQLYDPNTDTWFQETPLPTAAGNNSGNWLGSGFRTGGVLSAGGYSAGQVGTTYRGSNMPGGSPPESPAAPANFTVEDNGAALIASLSWTNPTTTVSGNPLTSIDSVVVLRDQVMVHFFAPATPGQALQWDDNTLTQAGQYTYTVYCVNAAGAGSPASGSAWIGPDVPDNVNNLLLTPAPNYALQGTLTWINPTSGAHGGFYPGITGYTIERSDGATFNLVGTATQYVDNTVPEAGYYYYLVTPYNNSGNGETAQSNEAWIGVPQIWTWETTTYEWNDISGTGANAGLNSDDQNVGPFDLGFDFEFFDGQIFNSIRLCSNGWQSFTSTSTIYTNPPIPTAAEPNNLIASFWDDLSFSSGGVCYVLRDLTNGRFVIQYTNVPFFTGGGTATFQVVLDESEGDITVYYNSFTGLTNSCTVGIENGTGTDGVQVCYNGTGPFIPANETAIRFNPPLAGAPGQPNVVSDLTATVGFQGALSCSLSWTNPTIDALGQPLTELLGAKVVRMDTIVANIPSDSGEAVTFVDNTVPNAGLYEYTVYAYNSAYDGLPTTTDPLWIGEDVPGAVTSLLMTPGPNYQMFATLTWVNPTAGAHGGYFTTILGYHIERSDGATFDLVGETTTYVDNTVPTPDYYSYTVTPYNASGDGLPTTSNTAYIGAPQIYTWEEIPYEWDDISGVGTPVTLSDDQNAGPFDLGMNFEYYETFFSTIRICSNGFLSFTSTSNSLSEQQMPNPTEPNNTIAFFWDDLNPGVGGTVHYYYNSAEHKFTVQFTNVPHYSSGGPYTMQAVIRQDGTISYYYHTINPPNNSCAVGCENATGTEGVLICYDGVGDFLPTSGTAVRINPPVVGFGAVMGHVTLDGAIGNITNVQLTDGFGALAFCQSNGDYTLDSARAGDRFINASYPGFFYDSTRMVTVIMNDTLTGVDFTLRRLEPTVPTGLAAVVDTANGHVTLTWDDHPDPSVDNYLLQRMRYGGAWEALATVLVPTNTYMDPLPEEGQWFYRIAASDLNVQPPPSQSAWSEPIELIWGELPPNNLTLNGNYDDRIRLRWHAPGGSPNPPVELFYDDGTAEAWYVVQFPNGPHDYFAVRFTLPQEPELVPPIEFRYAAIMTNGTQGYTQVMVCADVAGVPDVNNPLTSVPNVVAPQAMDWAIATFDDFALETTDDFWVVVQFTPGLSGDGIGSDASAPDSRSYWYYDTTPGVWHQWTAHDWMMHAFLGAEEDGGLLSLGPSGSSGRVLPFESTPIVMPSVTEKGSRGPQRSQVSLPSTYSFGVPQLIWNTGTLTNQLGSPVWTQPSQLSNSRNGITAPSETDQILLYYRIYRDGAYLDTSYATEYFDIGLAENVPHRYWVTGYYDNGAESGASNTDSAMCNMAPAEPRNFDGVANATEDSMILTWDDPTLNADGSPCVDLAQLTINRDGVFLTNVAPGVERYVDGVPNLTMTYTWTIRAKDEVPNTSAPATFVGEVQSPWNEIPYFWNDISTVGTVTPLSDDQNVGPFDLGFNVTFYGNTFNSIRICSNGFLSFTSTSNSLSEMPIPNAGEPNNLIAFFWDDLNPGAGGTVYRYADPATHWFTVQFTNVPHYSVGGPYTMQVIVTDQSAIYMNYNTINPPNNSCTVGVENATGTMGIQVCYDGVGDFLPHSNSSIAFWAGPPPQGDLDGYVYENAIPNDPIEGALVVCGMDSGWTAANGHYHIINILQGTYDATASFFGYNSETEPVEIVADSTTDQDFYLTQPLIMVDESSIEVAIPAGGSRQETFNISNMGDGTLDFDIEVDINGRIATRMHSPSPSSQNRTPVASNVASSGPLRSGSVGSFNPESDAAPVHAPYRQMEPEPFSVDEIIWTVGVNMPTARYSGASGTYNGEVFIAQGRVSDASPYNTAVVEAYDYDGNSWRTNCASAPTARRMVAFGAMFEDEFLYVAGGRDNNSTTVGTFEIYNMATDTWTTGPQCSPRWALGGAVLDGYVYVFGSDGSMTPNTLAQRYNIATSTWQAIADMPSGDGWVCGAAAAGKVYCIGGSSSPTAMREYDPATNTWALKTPIPHGRTYSTAVGANNLVYVVGGDAAGNRVDVYDPATDTWIADTNTPNIISWPQMGVAPGYIFVIGGTPQSTPVQYQNQVWIGQVGEPQEPWIWVTPESGTVEPQESQLITVDFLMPDTAEVGDVYTADLIITNNTITPTITVPVTVNIVPSAGDPGEILPLDYALFQNYPNPFNPTTRIRFDLRERSHVVLEIFNILGQRVTIVIDRTMDAGHYTATFDASKMASGVYFYRISANDFRDLKKMVLIR